MVEKLSRRAHMLAMAALALASAGLGTAVSAAPDVTMVRAWEHPVHTRLVMEMSAEVDFLFFALSRPRRLVIDFPELSFSLTRDPMGGKSVGLVQAMRFGLFAPGTSRVVLDLAGPARVKAALVLPPADGKPYRFVLDLEATDVASFAQNVRPLPAPIAQPAEIVPPIAAVPERHGGKPVIIIDAGHGGVDPGAIGATGIYEKTIALAAARQLAERLRAGGRYHVVLTRDTDVFLRLRRRFAMARHASADLFLSLHADSIANAAVRGSHVYTLSKKASDSEAEALAAKENKADIIAGVDLAEHSPVVNTILVDLTQRETNNRSLEIADRMVEALRRAGLPSLSRPHRQAGFAVLKAPDVPSVLIELGFLSNAEDEAMLADAAARLPLIAAIVGAIDRHFATRITAR
jgi:N-acetylmuramoyl-L-alanine amidase